MSFAVEPGFVPYIMPLVPEAECDVHQRRAQDEANSRQRHPHGHTPSSGDSTALPAEPESSPLIGRLVNVLA